VLICCVYGDSISGGDVVCRCAVYMVTAIVGVRCVLICCVYGDIIIGGDVVCLYAVYMMTAIVGVTLCVDMLCIW